MQHQVDEKKIAGGIVMISHGGETWLHPYGQMDIEADKPMKADTIFRLYSMSKAATTAGAARRSTTPASSVWTTRFPNTFPASRMSKWLRPTGCGLPSGR